MVKNGLRLAEAKNGFETSITDEAMNLIIDLSEGYPHFVQQFSYSAFDHDSNDVIDAGDVYGGAYKENGAIAQLGRKYFNEMYYGKISSPHYRQVLNAMAEHRDEWQSRKMIMEESGVKATTVNNALAALKARNIIIADGSRQGYYRLPTKSFADKWINAVKSVEEKSRTVVGLPFDETFRPTEAYYRLLPLITLGRRVHLTRSD